MLEPAELKARLIPKIEAGVKAHGNDPEALAADILNDALDLALHGFACGVRCAASPEIASAILADLTGHADQPNTTLAPGVSRKRVSRALVRARRALGLPTENPNKGR